MYWFNQFTFFEIFILNNKISSIFADDMQYEE